MVPTFPVFRRLTSSDTEIIKEYTKDFLPYSDYNFVSLWSYDTEEKIEISDLHHNLVVKFTDYITNEVFLSFIGKNDVVTTIQELHSFAENQMMSTTLQLIPEEIISVAGDLDKHFRIEEDEGNHDYILSAELLKEYRGNKFSAKRNFVNRFQKLYPTVTVSQLDLSDPTVQGQINDVFKRWKDNKQARDDDTRTEHTAINRLFTLAQDVELLSIGLFNQNQLIGFSINELTHKGHGIIHFEKADTTYVGIYAYLKQLTARFFYERGYTHINYEQDLGIEGLRKAKESYHPSHKLRKYSISPLI